MHYPKADDSRKAESFFTHRPCRWPGYVITPPQIRRQCHSCQEPLLLRVVAQVLFKVPDTFL